MNDAITPARPPALEALLRVALALAIARRLSAVIYAALPTLHGPAWSGIVSNATISGVDSRSNYLVYFVCLALTTVVAIGSLSVWPTAVLLTGARKLGGMLGLNATPEEWAKWRSKQKLWLQYHLGEWGPAAWSGLKKAVQGLCERRLLLVITGVLVTATWILNVEATDLGKTMKDVYHEGESLGFAPTLLQGHGVYSVAFFIHGLGMDALPELLARWLGYEANGIAAVRLFKVGFAALAWLGGLALLYPIVPGSASGKKPSLGRYLAVALLFLLANHGLYIMTMRRALCLFQLAGILLYVRRAKEEAGSQRGAALLAFVIGLSGPVAFLYNMAEAANIAVCLVVATLLMPLLGRRALFPWLIGQAAGVALASSALATALGPKDLLAMLEQIRYWATYGREIWFIPFNPRRFASAYFWVTIVAQGLALTHLALAWRRSRRLSSALRDNASLVLLLVSSLLAARIGLDRAFESHLGWGAVFSVYLLFALALHWLFERPDAPEKSLPLGVRILAGLGVLSLVASGLVANARHLDPLHAIAGGLSLGEQLETLDSNVLPEDYQMAASAMRAAIAPSRTFYTLTSEGVWYYLFGKPSASSYQHLLYARTPAAQDEVVQDLVRNRPDYVLLSNSTKFDLQPDLANHRVYQYVIAHYRPFQHIFTHWFWKRAAHALQRQAGPETIKGDILGAGETTEGTHLVNGWLSRPSWATGGQLQLFVSGGSGDELLTAQELPETGVPESGQRVEWRIEVPTAFLKPGEQHFRVWLYDAHADLLRPVTPS